MWDPGPVNVPPPGGGGNYGIVGGLVSAAAGIYDTYQSSKTARENTDKTLAANSAEAQKAYEREIEMWNMQNAYNSPAAQMARYQEAGLNPHMVGQSGTGAGNASQMPKYNAPQQNYQYQAPRTGAAIMQILPTIMQVGTWMQQMKMSEAQIKNMSSQQDLRATQQEKIQQAIEYLESANPELLAQIQKNTQLKTYQTYGAQSKSRQQEWLARQSFGQLIRDYGADFARSAGEGDFNTNIGGTAAEIVKQQQIRSTSDYYKSKVAGAQASYADYGITDPQSLIRLVVGGVLSTAMGAPVRINQNRRAKSAEAERYARDRMTTHRETYNRGKTKVTSTWRE